MMITSTTRSLASIAIAFQLALSLTVKEEHGLCHGFSVGVAPRSGSTSTVLDAHARRTHTYEQDSATVFSQMDKDGNGKIDRQELRDYLVEKGPYTDAVARSIFERLDVNRDGHLVLEELEEGLHRHQLLRATQRAADPQARIAIKPKMQQEQEQQQRSHRKRAKQIQHYKDQAHRFFRKLDVNRSGYISLTELKEYFMVQRMQVVAQSSGLLSSLTGNNNNNKKKKINTNNKRKQEGDFVVSWQHSEAAIQKLFQVMDVNHDGRITLQDLKEAFIKYPSVRHAFQA